MMRVLGLSLILGSFALSSETSQMISDVTGDFSVPEGFKVERLFKVPKELGSWIAMANLPDGRLVTGDQYGGLYLVKVKGNQTVVEKMPLKLEGAHGLLWHHDSLYVTVNEGKQQGIYRAQDLNGDGIFETLKKLSDIGGGGEHGGHSLVSSPDGDWIYLIGGNRAKRPKFDKSWIPEVWAEDHLLPRNPDGRGHASDLMAPGGWVARFKPDGTQWEFVGAGFRNPYDMAFNEDGALFAYDADMEWDLGMPWYRPTRLCHVVAGAEFGWRNGTGKWPIYYEDSLDGVADLGPGSPTGVVSGRGAKFPAKYQKAIYCYDWTFATIYAVHLTPNGVSYRGEKEEFLTTKGKELPLTDGVIGKDGAMYFTTGGRRLSSSLWRVSYHGQEDTKSVWQQKASAVSQFTIDSKDRASRFQARVALEREGVEAVRNVRASTPIGKITRAIALSRLGSAADRADVFSSLIGIDWQTLSREDKLSWLRACDLLFIRHGQPTIEERTQILDKVDRSFPATDRDLNAELCRLLCYLEAPRIVTRTLSLLALPSMAVLPDWARLVDRNQTYGADLANTLRSIPPSDHIHYAYCLRVVKGPWSKNQRRQLMEWYAKVEGKKAGRSYALFLRRMKEDTLKNATAEERQMISEWKLDMEVDPFADLPLAKGPGRAWAVDGITAAAVDLSENDEVNGKVMFQAARCVVCHRFDGEGGASGPDLSTLAGRFSAAEVAVAILEPSKEISDQYEFVDIVTKDGTPYWGRILEEKDGVIHLANNAFDLTKKVLIKRAEVKTQQPSKVSPMPPATIYGLNEKELKDLLKYLLKK